MAGCPCCDYAVTVLLAMARPVPSALGALQDCLCINHGVGAKHGSKMFEKLKQLHFAGYGVVIFTNESLGRYKNEKSYGN